MGEPTPSNSLPLPVARTVHDHAHHAVSQTITLTYDARFLRRKRLLSDQGAAFLVDLPQTISVNHGAVFVLDDSTEVLVQAAVEPLLAVSGPDLVRLAWHIGNRHCPCQIEADRLVIQREKVIAEMLALLGANILEISEPFTPEGGAYGHGRTHSHAH